MSDAPRLRARLIGMVVVLAGLSALGWALLQFAPPVATMVWWQRRLFGLQSFIALVLLWPFYGMFLRGRWSFPVLLLIGLAGVLFAQLSFQGAYIWEGVKEVVSVEIARSLAFANFGSAMLLVSLIGLRRIGAGAIYRIYCHVGESAAIADLAAIDPEAAERLAAEARRLTAERMVRHVPD